MTEIQTEKVTMEMLYQNFLQQYEDEKSEMHQTPYILNTYVYGHNYILAKLTDAEKEELKNRINERLVLDGYVNMIDEPYMFKLIEKNALEDYQKYEKTLRTYDKTLMWAMTSLFSMTAFLGMLVILLLRKPEWALAVAVISGITAISTIVLYYLKYKNYNVMAEENKHMRKMVAKNGYKILVKDELETLNIKLRN